MTPRLFWIVAVVCAAGIGLSCAAQESILEFSVARDPVPAVAGETSFVSIGIANRSVYEADDIEFLWSEDPAQAVVESVEVLGAFDSVAVGIPLSIAAGAPVGEAERSLEVVYTYCMDDLCFQISEVLSIRVLVAEAVAGPTGDEAVQSVSTAVAPAVHGVPETSSGGWEVPLGSALFLIVAALVALSLRPRIRSIVLQGGLVVVLAGALTVGVLLRQADQAQSIGSVLCTSCVGIEQAHAPVAEWSASSLASLAAIDVDVDLIVFTAPWCHSCPYAKAMVAAAAAANAHIRYRLVDVEEDPAEAEVYGVIRSGRTIVPAVLRVDNGEIVFGVEDLEARLLTLLGGSR